VIARMVNVAATTMPKINVSLVNLIASGFGAM
jgi:hypothetical protein